MSKYLGDFQIDAGLEEKLNYCLVKESYKSGGLPAFLIFWKKYNRFPRSVEIAYGGADYVPYSHIIKVLKEDYNHNIEDDLIQFYENVELNYKYAYNQLTEVTEGVMINFQNGALVQNYECTPNVDYDISEGKYHHIINGYKILYLPGKEDIVDKLRSRLTSIRMKYTVVVEASLQMICKNQYGFYLTSIKIKKPKISDLKLHYGDHFEQTHKTILNTLKAENSTGIILLHGLPGTGKTHYIRYLIQEITEKQIIYIPPDMTSSISAPEFFPFMLQNKDSILIIEDAENIIKSRSDQDNTTQAVANLLNLSDGLLGDSLHQPIIATFNCELSSIDSALLRKGRLIANYEFGKLDVQNSQKLSDHLGHKTQITEPMTLADIYGQEADTVEEPVVNDSKK